MIRYKGNDTERQWDAVRDVVLFVQSNKREKHPWRSTTFSKAAGFSL